MLSVEGLIKEKSNYVCPRCRCQLKEDKGQLFCQPCSKSYVFIGSVPDFREADEYWGNVSREKMKALNQTALQTGDWLTAAKNLIPEYAEHFIPLYRADSQFLWPTNKDSVVLDAGSMWGGLTVPMAQFHREIYAIDKTVETLEFLKVRAAQMGFNNIHVAAASLKALPFPDQFFDHVVVNGVVEWLGLEEDTILEQHWEGKREQKMKYSKSPRAMQLDVLKELCRVLKPNGSLFVAIENRYGIQYFLAHPDDHNNVYFITFMPRWWANMVSKLAGKAEYRTHIYSPGQLTALLQEAGLKVQSMYGVAPHYIKIQKYFPLRMTSLFQRSMKVDRLIPKLTYQVVKYFVPAAVMKHCLPSLSAICTKNDGPEPMSRLHRALIQLKILKEGEKVNFVISNNRYENYNSVNVVVYDAADQPKYFCKIARDLKISGLKTEAENLRWFSEKLSAAASSRFKTPRLIYVGHAEGMEILVTDFLNARNAGLFPFCLARFIFNKLHRLRIKADAIGKKLEAWEERSFVRKMDSQMKQAMDALIAFQKASSLGTKKINGIDVPVAVVHGDYCFDNLLLYPDGQVGLTDFEHSEKKGDVLFDLGVLVFEPLIARWKTSYLREAPLAVYLKKYGGKEYIRRWLAYFCNQHDLPDLLIPLIPSIVAKEQNLKVYPPFRDPYTYPMYGQAMVKEMAQIVL